MSTEITVRGSFAAFERPERGTVHATIAYEGPAMEPVYGRVARDLEVVKASIGRLDDKDNGAVTWWSADQLRTWSNRPWNKDGKQLPLVHHASVGLEVKFRDFSALSRWVGEHVANTEGFRVSHVEWALTAKRRAKHSQKECAPGRRDAVTVRSNTPTRSGLARSTGRHRRRRNARHSAPEGGPRGRLDAGRRPGGGRMSNSYRNTSRFPLRSTRDSSPGSRPPRRSVCVMAELKDRLRADLTAAMKSQDQLRTATLRMLFSAVQTEEVSGDAGRTCPTPM